MKEKHNHNRNISGYTLKSNNDGGQNIVGGGDKINKNDDDVEVTIKIFVDDGGDVIENIGKEREVRNSNNTDAKVEDIEATEATVTRAQASYLRDMPAQQKHSRHHQINSSSHPDHDPQQNEKFYGNCTGCYHEATKLTPFIAKQIKRRSSRNGDFHKSTTSKTPSTTSTATTSTNSAVANKQNDRKQYNHQQHTQKPPTSSSFSRDMEEVNKCGCSLYRQSFLCYNKKTTPKTLTVLVILPYNETYLFSIKKVMPALNRAAESDLVKSQLSGWSVMFIEAESKSMKYSYKQLITNFFKKLNFLFKTFKVKLPSKRFANCN
ncbi:hypothetical protein HELRODRAFT_166254 [Helobdella robusta]|uniref:Uncharacterized protein n=1 Tax=Helobdella robusta TaxID=6412 RepID=T1EXY2_HELRO|nr:hypothetical protein HELRODRAFT_166254 [Helobdella robusta]ESN90570.1 hypothetical protein HELRODRAFT_166254 [Helobdella robusta]